MGTAIQDLVARLDMNIKPFKGKIITSRNMMRELGKSLSRVEQTNKTASVNMIAAMSKFGQAAKDAKKPVETLAKTVSKTGQATANFKTKSGTAARGLLELSRGAEDAAVSFGVNGWQGALRGSTNNLTQFAFIAGGPAAGAIAGFVAAGVSMIPVLFKIGQGGKDAAKGIEKMNDALERQIKLNLANLQFGRQRQDIGPSDLPGALQARKSARQRLEDAGVRKKGAEDKRGARIREFGKGVLGKLGEETDQNAFLDAILRQRGFKPGKSIGPGIRAGQSKARKGVRSDLSIGNVKPEFIEEALNPSALKGLNKEFKEFTKKSTEGLTEAIKKSNRFRDELNKTGRDVERIRKNLPPVEAVRPDTSAFDAALKAFKKFELSVKSPFEQASEALKRTIEQIRNIGRVAGKSKAEIDALVGAVRKQFAVEAKKPTGPNSFQKRRAREQQAVFNATRTRRERLAIEVKRIKGLGLGKDLEGRALKGALGKFEASRPAPPKVRSAGIAEAGSQQAFSNIVNARQGRSSPEQKIEKNTAKAANSLDEVVAKIEALTKKLTPGELQIIGNLKP